MNRSSLITGLAVTCTLLAGNAFAKTCTDQAVEKFSSYNQASSSSIFGLIKRVVFKPDHTLVVLQGYEDEACAILPPRADLERRNVNLDWLKPGRSFGIRGNQHKAEDRRIWVLDVRNDPGIDDPVTVR